MRINRFIGVTASAVLLMVFLSANKTSSYNSHQHEAPPNGVEISNSLFCDRTEISNIYWREYMYWQQRVFGPKSQEYISILPDTLSWLEVDSCLDSNVYYYLKHPEYNDSPVVGISQEQAEGFSEWRSDRVFEVLLIKYKIIRRDPNQTKGDYFTIEKFFNGELKTLISDKKVNYYPDFRLPTMDERQIVLAYSDSLDDAYFDKCKSKYCSECKENYPEIWSDIKPCEADMDVPPATRSVESGCVSKKGNPIFNLRGNVGEWTSDADIAAGGGWNDTREEILNADTFRYSEPNAWTGFRNVFEWKKWEE